MARLFLIVVLVAGLSGLSLAASPQALRDMSERQMAARVDELLAKKWAENKVRPAPPASDAEFLRRACLDLTGIIPTVHQVHDFLADKDPHKRAELIRQLLAKPTYATHFANVWRNVMLPDESNARRFGFQTGFQNWLRGQFADEEPYDKMVTSLLIADGSPRQVSPALFYTALELKPEELAASTSRIFLGVQIQCAQCHDHPFDHWTRKDFWGYAAFFARLTRPRTPQQALFSQVNEGDLGEVTIPESGEVVRPKYLGGDASSDDGPMKRRARLAAWLTAADNPYFAKAAVNRVWALLFGRGIVEPVDDLGQHNAPSHPQLFDELGVYFAQTGFDLKRLIRTLTATRAYQLSSQSSEEGGELQGELFARMAIKTLTADQLYDCLTEAMRGRQASNSGLAFRGRTFDQNRQNFLAKFRAPTQGLTEYESGIPQALTLMNGAIVRRATDIQQSDILVALDTFEFPGFTEENRVETLFLSTLSRFPSEKERKKFGAYATAGAKQGQRRKALGDILWALINSAEFTLNH